MNKVEDRIAELQFNSIKRELITKHGSLESPDFHFRWDVLKERPYRELVDEAMTHFFIKESTDLNQDGSFVYLIKGERGTDWMLQLSMVGPYAVLLRIQKDQTLLIDQSSHELLQEEAIIARLTTKYGVSLLSARVLVEPIALKLDYTDSENVRIYQALFSDTDTLPWSNG